MAERRRRLIGWLLPKLLIFALGAAAGYYARGREVDRLQDAYQQAASELQQLRESGQDMIERGRRAGENLKAGAKAAADSTKAAIEEVKGGGGE